MPIDVVIFDEKSFRFEVVPEIAGKIYRLAVDFRVWWCAGRLQHPSLEILPRASGGGDLWFTIGGGATRFDARFAARFAMGIWVGGGFQYEFHSPLTLTTGEPSLNLAQTHAASLLLQSRLRAPTRPRRSNGARGCSWMRRSPVSGEWCPP